MYVQPFQNSFNINKLIEKVVFKKHWSFRGSDDFIRVKAPFRYGCQIWGYFDSPMIIHFKNWVGIQPLNLNHQISIEGTGEHHVFPIEINKQKMPQNFLLNRSELTSQNRNSNQSSNECRIF